MDARLMPPLVVTRRTPVPTMSRLGDNAPAPSPTDQRAKPSPLPIRPVVAATRRMTAAQYRRLPSLRPLLRPFLRRVLHPQQRLGILALAIGAPLLVGGFYALLNAVFHPPYLPIAPFLVMTVALAAQYGPRVALVSAFVSSIVWVDTTMVPYDVVMTQMHVTNGLPMALDITLLVLGGVLTGVWSDRWRAQRRAEMQVREDLAEARGAREAFMATAAHELRTPLTVQRLVTQAQLVRLQRENVDANGMPLDPRRKDELELTDQAIDRMTRTVNAMLTDAQLMAGRVFADLTTCDLGALVTGAVEHARYLWPERTISSTVPRDPVLVRADSDHLLQVLDHLLHNALKYSAPDTPVDVTLYLLGQSDPPRAEVTVTDRGTGIPLAEQRAIWERFHQVPDQPAPGASSHLGLGLGLHLVSRLITQQQGTYGVRSVPGAGSSFWFNLPLLLPPSPSPPPLPPASPLS